MPGEALTKLLIVDDLPENLQALEALIRDDDREVHQASSGVAALDLLLEHEFALAIIDVQMPGMDGFELAELMRGAERTRHIPIVFVSAAGRELNYAFKGYEAGAVDFLHKPLDSDAVRSKVSVFVALYQQRMLMRTQLAALEKSRLEQQQLLEALHTTQEQLQRAVRMRDDFMSMVAHEMRTPLNTLFLECQVRTLRLEKGDMSAFTPERLQAMMVRDARQIRSMVRLVDDMLDVSRLRSGQLSIKTQEMELRCLLQRTITDLSHQVQAAGSPISLDAPIAIRGIWDEFRIEQVIVNLLTNALRYGAGKPIQVSLRQDEHHATIEVTDQGIGISPESQSRIFQPFERIAQASNPAGLGLGLYIARQLVEAHQGSIGVDSRTGEGSTFHVRLPVHSVAERTAAHSH